MGPVLSARPAGGLQAYSAFEDPQEHSGSPLEWWLPGLHPSSLLKIKVPFPNLSTIS